MSKPLVDFLIKLAEEPELQKSYAAHPEAAMTQHGLSDDEKAVLRTGNEKAILAHIAGPSGVMNPKLILKKLILAGHTGKP